MDMPKDGKVQQAFDNGNQNSYEKGFQAGHDKCEEEFNGSYYILLTTTVTRADASTETMADRQRLKQWQLPVSQL